MQQPHQSQEMSVASSRRIMLVLMSLGTLYQYMYCSMLSSAFGLLPVFGGAMFMSARVATTMTHTVFGDGRKYLTHRMRIAFVIVTIIMLLCTLGLLTLYPILLSAAPVWIIFAVVLLITVRSIIGRRLTGRRMRRTIGKSAFWALLAIVYLLPLGIVAWLLFAFMNPVSAGQLLGGFGAGMILEAYALWRERDLLALEGVPDHISPETVAHIADELRHVNAYSSFQRLHMLVLVALQLTLVLVYTFIGLTAQELLTAMLLAVTATVVMRELSVFCLRHIRRPFESELLLVGLFLWFYGLFLFYRQMANTPSVLWSYLSLCLCISGLSVSVTALAELERRMTDVAVFKLENQMLGYSQMRAASTELAILMGQMIALILLTLLCMPVGMIERIDLAALIGSIRPILIVPPLLLLVCAIVSALHFPMNNRYFKKLARWLTLESEGEDNPALKKQLESVVVKRHKNRFGVKLIILLLRPLYYHRVLGKQNLAGYEDGDIILICNHGEIYGPVVANLYIPIAFRPWVINNMMEREAIIEHMYQGTMVRQKWIPERLKRPLIRLITPLFMWVFNSLEAIPVYRGKPRELMKTFRVTLDAMQAGDNILLFPENGEDHEPVQPGYARDGVGQLYTGFAMLAPMYYAKTKRCAAFVPIYASRKNRTLTIGRGIVYNPQASAGEEKLRIVSELLNGMQTLCDKERADARP